MNNVVNFWQRLSSSVWGLPALLTLAVAALYANSFPGNFILDDRLIVVQNPLVQHLDVKAIFTSDYWHGVNNSGLFRPLTILSLALNYSIFGPSPVGFHLFNVLLHAAVTILTWYSLRVWGIPVLAATCASVFFAIHPLHTEVINEVVGRSELLAAFFLLLAFIAARKTFPGASVLVCFSFCLALLAKEHAITFLVLLPLADGFTCGSLRIWRQRWPLYLGLLLLAAVWLLWRAYGVDNPIPAMPPSFAAAPLAHVDPTTRFLTALHLQWLYIAKLLVPLNLQAVYSTSDLPVFTDTLMSFSALLIVSGTVVALTCLCLTLRQGSVMSLFILFYLLAFLPTSNLLFPIGVTFAERLSYFPSVWFSAALGMLASRWFEIRRQRYWILLVLTCYAASLAGMTVLRNPDFKDEPTLWRVEVDSNPADYVGWLNLAESHLAQGDLREADKAYRVLQTLASDDPTVVRSRLAYLLMVQDHEQAIPIARRLLREDEQQNNSLAMAFDARTLAEALVIGGVCEEALTYLDGPALPLRNQPQTMEARFSALSCLDRDDDVIREFIRLEPSMQTSRMRYLYAVSLLRRGRTGDARIHMEQAVKIDAQEGASWNLLGVVCVQQRDWPRALEAFQQAVALTPNEPSFRDNLQRAQLEARADGK